MSVAITGNTFSVKDELKALGGRWNPEQKAWMVPDDKADQARALVNKAPKSTPRKQGGVYDANKFNGYGARKGGYRKACVSDGNCSSMGSGRSCGGYDCDGY